MANGNKISMSTTIDDCARHGWSICLLYQHETHPWQSGREIFCQWIIEEFSCGWSRKNGFFVNFGWVGDGKRCVIKYFGCSWKCLKILEVWLQTREVVENFVKRRDFYFILIQNISITSKVTLSKVRDKAKVKTQHGRVILSVMAQWKHMKNSVIASQYPHCQMAISSSLLGQIAIPSHFSLAKWSYLQGYPAKWLPRQNTLSPSLWI